MLASNQVTSTGVHLSMGQLLVCTVGSLFSYFCFAHQVSAVPLLSFGPFSTLIWFYSAPSQRQCTFNTCRSANGATIAIPASRMVGTFREKRHIKCSQLLQRACWFGLLPLEVCSQLHQVPTDVYLENKLNCSNFHYQPQFSLNNY